MFVTNNFKSSIANFFYDKKIYFLVDTDVMDSEGDVTKTLTSAGTFFYGNVNFSNVKALQEELGITENIDIYITCLPSVNISLNDFISYNNVNYKVTSVVPYDSHLGIVGTICQ